MEHQKMTHDEWIAEGVKRFGSDVKLWRFVCPCCGHPQTIADYLALGVDKDTIGRVIGFSCIGRFLDQTQVRDAFGQGNGPCNYAGGGLFKLNPIEVERDGETQQVFQFDQPFSLQRAEETLGDPPPVPDHKLFEHLEELADQVLADALDGGKP